MPENGENQDGNIIQASALSFSKFTTWGAGVGTLGAAVTAFLEIFQAGENPVIIASALAVVAVGLLAIAFVTMADVWSRAYVTAAKLKASSPDSAPDSASDTVSSTKETSTLTTTGTPFFVQLDGKGHKCFTVLALRWDAATKATTYLVVEESDRPIWVEEEMIREVEFSSPTRG